MKTKQVLGIAAAALAVLVLIIAVSACASTGSNQGYLRIHIRANSNTSADQNIKYEVKEAVVSFLTPLIANCKSKDEAIAEIEKNLNGIAKKADSVLAAKGFSYQSEAKVKREEFPDRTYDGVTLEAGVYDALIVNLGTGQGDNWWCVVYPPLCFVSASGTDSDGITYKSKIKEIIDSFFKN